MIKYKDESEEMKVLLNVALYILSLGVSLVPSKYIWTGEKWEWRESNDNEIGDIERAPREFDGSGDGQVILIHDEEDSIQSSLFLPQLRKMITQNSTPLNFLMMNGPPYINP